MISGWKDWIGWINYWLPILLCPQERREYEFALDASRAALGEEAFFAAWETGRSMTDDQVRRYAADLPAGNLDVLT